MSLSKQLLTLISALFLLIFSLNFILSVNNIREYLQGEAKIHAQDTATSLGLSLAPYITDPSDHGIKAMINAIFDMGYYKEIRLVDNKGIDLVLLGNDQKIEGVPDWFIEYLPMSSATASSEISSDWQIRGVVYVTVNVNYAYLKLYAQAKTTFYYSLAAFIASIVLLSLALRITLASLIKIDQMALALANGHFVTIDNLPWTSEVRNVAKSMNVMSQKIQTMFTALNNQLESIGSGLLRDELTGLFKKSVFETDFNHTSPNNDDAFCVLLKFDSLSELAKLKDSQTIDNYLRNFAEILRNVTDQQTEYSAKAYRFHGAEFALLVTNSHPDQIENLVLRLGRQFSELGQAYQHPDLVHIGVVPIHSISSLENILATVYEAYEQAKLIGPNRHFIRKSADAARDMTEWTELVSECVENRRYSVVYKNRIKDVQSAKLLIEEAVIEIFDRQAMPVAIAPFIAIAENTGKIIDLDKGVFSQVLNHLRDKLEPQALALNLSTQSIKDAHFRLWLTRQIDQNPASAKRLVFSLSAYAVSKDIETYLEFIDLVHQWGSKVMIKRFESLSLGSAILKKLRPDYIRLALKLTTGISHSQQKQDFVQTLQTLASLIDSKILAEEVNDVDDLHTLKTIGILGANG
ncbi:EAL domain-containing protein [Methylomonas sp. LL1]|uniref:bifunctional diguanylate cyclase/phosphodiesterase n=1 Tax=Methylomonas sp. LL1 TaxID=2785785 RepID=UPI0018C445E2|nr:LapD/MoxY N-terminal periplasmic domain-containing protein [Methylomonas sp. LL1]QPK65245.1 EAL domain-containing protein [Methylomonas sp. LL1]